MSAGLALAGIRVLDLTALTPGPFASEMLAELGATVIKVERPGSGDPLRAMLPESFELVNRGKYSIALDLKNDADRATLLALCRDAHVFMEGSRPGVADRLGVGFDAVSAISPHIVYLSMSGYGSAGPLADLAGHDLNYVAYAGGVALTGVEDGIPGYDGTYQIADLAATSYAVITILAALRVADRGAVRADVSLWASALGFSRLAAAEAVDVGHGDAPTERPRERRGANGVFRAAGGALFTLAAVEDVFWVALCDVLDDDRLSAERYASYNLRLKYGPELNVLLDEIFGAKTRDHWIDALGAAGIPSSPLLTWSEAMNQKQVAVSDLASGFHNYPRALPVVGLETRALRSAPAIDADGPALRDGLWPDEGTSR